MMLEEDQPMAGLTILEQVAGSHCMRRLNPAVIRTNLHRSYCWMSIGAGRI